MHITCEEIGGYYYQGGMLSSGQYFEDAEPCHAEGWVDPDKMTPGQIAGITIAAVFGTMLAGCCYCFWKLPRRKSKRKRKKNRGGQEEVTVEFSPPPSTGVVA